MNGRPTPSAVVFDMGGVLVELGPLDELLGGVGLDVAEFWPRWLTSPSVRDFEMGRCDATEFGDRLIDELGLSIGADEVVERLAAWPRGLYPGAAELVAELEVTTGLLSNTNALHWDTQRDAERLRQMFDRTYLSYELGLAKPDREIFDLVVADLGMAATEIVFLDDNQINVDGALAVGIDAVLVRGPTEARSALRERGLLA